jgi:hypothetical protein
MVMTKRRTESRRNGKLGTSGIAVAATVDSAIDEKSVA